MGTFLTTIESAGAREMEQPKVGPKGEGAGATESKDTGGTEEEVGDVLRRALLVRAGIAVSAGVAPALPRRWSISN